MLYLSSVRCGDVVVRNLRHHGHGLAHAAHVHVLDLKGALGRVGTSTTPMHAARALATMPLRVFSRRERTTLRAFTSGSTGLVACSSNRVLLVVRKSRGLRFFYSGKGPCSTNFSCSPGSDSRKCPCHRPYDAYGDHVSTCCRFLAT